MAEKGLQALECGVRWPFHVTRGPFLAEITMAIRVACPGCSKIIVADDHDAGRRARCPECHATLTLPGAGYEQQPFAPAYAFGGQASADRSAQGNEEVFAEPLGNSGRDELIACPYCAEPIRYGARKCRHCGEYLDDDLRRQQARAAAYANPLAADAKPNPGIAAVLSLIFPGAGQLYRQKIGAGIAWIVFVFIGYMALVIPGFILHALCIYDAATND
jgi:TM2 domain-containing membrane protein YozV